MRATLATPRRSLIATGLGVVLVSIVTAMPAPATTPSGRATCTITGTPGPDTLVGTAGPDVICGLGGDDRLSGGGGADIIDGGSGNDTLVGGNGDDRLSGGSGTDTLIGDAGADTVTGGTGDDELRGGSGDDVMIGLTGDDELFGNPGDDRLTGGNGADFIDGGAGTDVCSPATDPGDELAVSCDARPPEVVTLSWTPRTVDTSLSAQTITVTGRFTDDLSGLPPSDYRYGAIEGRFVSPGGQNLDFVFSGNNQISGDELDGTFRDTITVPRYARRGTWTLSYLSLVDAIGNRRRLDTAALADKGFPTTFKVESPSDDSPPEVTSLSWTPRSVDTADAPRTITVTGRFTDDLAGLPPANYRHGAIEGRFVGPGGQNLDFVFSGNNQISGDELDGTFRDTITVPRFARRGTWTLSYLSLVDAIGNRRQLDTAALADRGLPTTFTQTGQSDSTPPDVMSLRWTPTTVNTAQSSQTITVTGRFTDDLSGLPPSDYRYGAIEGRFVSPGGQNLDFVFSGNNQISGDELDGTFRDTITVPRYARRGTWTLSYLSLVDAIGNRRLLDTAALAARGLPTSFTVS